MRQYEENFFNLVVIKSKPGMPFRCYKGQIIERDSESFILSVDMGGSSTAKPVFFWDEWDVEYIKVKK